MVLDAHTRNSSKDNKFNEIVQRNVEQEQTMYRDFETAENTKNKKLRKVYKEINFLWTDFKAKRNEKNDLMKTR